MKILDIDMDYFLDKAPYFISSSSLQRVNKDDYTPWKKDDIHFFLQNRLGLSKHDKIKGRIITHHHEAIYYWRELIKSSKLCTPFEVVHVDSHADMGLGCSSWIFIFEKLLGLNVEKRSEIENYKAYFDNYKTPDIGDYLLFALAFRWISSLTYVCNPNEQGNDYLYCALKNCIEPNDTIQLPYNEKCPASYLLHSYERKKYFESAQLEPEVPFHIIKKIEDINIHETFDFITFCISPNYTPETADFIIDLIKEYIIEEE